jgi:hypothetical protein
MIIEALVRNMSMMTILDVKSEEREKQERQNKEGLVWYLLLLREVLR